MTDDRNRPVTAEDYEEPACLLKMGDCGVKNRIPVDRIIARLDSLLDREDTAAAERHLKYWLDEAVSNGDKAGEATVAQEIAGFLRREGRSGEAVEYALRALDAIKSAGLCGTVSEATACLNAGTVFRAAGRNEESVAFFDRAMPVYRTLPEHDSRRAGLCNNRALALASVGRFPEAEESFREALEILIPEENPGERAVTYLNLADLYEKRDGPEDACELVSGCLDAAELELSRLVSDDGNAAFILEKCAPVFGYYGRIGAERDCAERAKEIRERLKK